MLEKKNKQTNKKNSLEKTQLMQPKSNQKKLNLLLMKLDLRSFKIYMYRILKQIKYQPQKENKN